MFACGIRKNSKRVAVYFTGKNVHIIGVAIVNLVIITEWDDYYNITFIDAVSKHRHIDIDGTVVISSNIVFAFATLLNLATLVVSVL